MSAVTGLGYLGLHAPDVEAWRTYATDLLGLQVATQPPAAPDRSLFLRMDERGWRFAIEPAESGGLAYTGWEVADPAALSRLADTLANAGIVVKEDTALAQARQVEALIRCIDPDGNNLEFFCGAYIPEQPFVSPRGVRFMTDELGMGHILHIVSDVEATKAFYLDVLGFRLSDTIMFKGSKVHFAHTNPRHHSLAFVEVPNASPGLNHVMLEVDSIDAVGRALDLVDDGMAELTETLGRHTNDRMLSFYMKTPSGFEMEYGCDARVIDEQTWNVSTYDSTSFWGHRPPGARGAASGTSVSH
jgi:2,3-dihydroxybiphenyl 1,2-dioxygenase